MAHHWRTLAFFFASILHARSSVEVLAPSYLEEVIPAGRFFYYGPLRRSADIVGEAEVISSSSRFFSGDCSQSDYAKASNKIAVVHIENLVRGFCDFDSAYLKLEKAGALAMVVICPWSPSTIRLSRHNKLVADYFNSHSLAAFAIYQTDSTIKKWNEAATSPITLRIDTSDLKAPSRILWTIAMRVLAPICALWTCVVGISEIIRTWSRRDTISRYMCYIEAPTCVLVALMLALGQYGKLLSFPRNCSHKPVPLTHPFFRILLRASASFGSNPPL